LLKKKAKILFKVILLIALFPSILLCIYGWEAFIPMLVYFQFLLIWAQVEVGMRQHILTRFQSEPSFAVEKKIEVGGASEKKVYLITINIKNISDWPSYNLFLARVLDEKFLPVKPNEWKKWLRPNSINYLLAGEEKTLCYVKEPPENFGGLIFEVHYRNRFGDFRMLHFRFLGEDEVLLMHEEPPKPGWLLRTLEEFSRAHNL